MQRSDSKATGLMDMAAAWYSPMAPFLSPEFRLVTACAMWPPSDRRTKAIRAASAQPLDWPRVLRVASRHQVTGLVHEGLTRTGPDVPPEIACEIGAQAATLIRKNLAMAREALRMQRLFDDADQPVLFIKGAALALLAFRNLGLRAGQDIDLLVPYETLPVATALILREGYRRFDPPPDIGDVQLRRRLPRPQDHRLVYP